MSNPFILGRDINGYVGFTLPPSTDIYSVTLTQGVVASFTVPTTYSSWALIFSIESGSDVWVSYTGTAAVPAGGTILSSKSELNPTGRTVKGGTIISMITPETTASVSMALWYMGNN